MRRLEEHADELLPLLLDYNYTVPVGKMKEVNTKIWNEYFFGDRVGSDVSNMLKVFDNTQTFNGNHSHVYLSLTLKIFKKA